ncbi:MAG: hypothetical protein CL610_06015 [Anaerolineaceae bacterium]|nr:hypothetical protein [Anaerolineaceae bacterium]
MTIFRTGEVRDFWYESLGGRDSKLREPITAQLGHPGQPPPNNIYLPPDIRDYVGQVWLHDVVGDFSLPDTETSPRTDAPGGVFTGFLAAENLLSGRRKFGTRVLLLWVNGRWEVQGVAGPAGEVYLEGTAEIEQSGFRREQLDWGLLRPDEPLSGHVILSGGQFQRGATWYTLPVTKSIDLIATYAGVLSAGQGRAIQLERDETDGSITYTAGSAFTDTSRDASGAVDHAAVFTNYPTGADDDLRHYGWVKLYYGITEITEQDILIAPGEGSGGGSADPSFVSGDTASFPANPHDGMNAYFNNENGDLYVRNGSTPAGWLGPYNLPSIGAGSSSISGYKIIGPDSVTNVADGNAVTLDFSSTIYDTDSYFDFGFNVQEIADGNYSLAAYIQCHLSSNMTALGYLTARLYVAFDGELVTEADSDVMVLPSGTNTAIYLAFNLFAQGNVNTPEEVQIELTNNTGQTVVIDYCQVVGTRLSDQLATP